MGAGASSAKTPSGGDLAPAALVAQQADKIHTLTSDLQRAQAEIAQLKQQTQSQVFGKSQQAPPQQQQQATPDAAAAGKRRGEVSAEAWAHQTGGSDAGAGNAAPAVSPAVPKPAATRDLIDAAVQRNMLFRGVRAEEKRECVDVFYKVELRAGEEATTQGDVGDKLFVIESGALGVWVAANDADAAHYGSLGAGDSFGELSLMYNTPRAATVRAEGACVLWALNRQDFRGISLRHKMLRKKQYEAYLHQVPDLAGLTPQELSRLADAVEEVEFEPGTVIIREGEIGDNFYIIVSGAVQYSKKDQGAVGEGGPGDYFGHKALLTEEKRAATVQAAGGKVSLLTMGRKDFVSLLGSLQELAQRGRAAQEAGAAQKHEQQNEQQQQQQASQAPEAGVKPKEAAKGAGGDAGSSEYKYSRDIKFEDLEMKLPRTGAKAGAPPREIILGQGAFGLVQIVKHRPTGETYALKSLNKAQIVANSLEAHVVDERRVMTMIDHPFLLKLYTSFWDGKNVYLLLELCLGGELFSVLRKAGRFAEKAARFYSGTVLQAFAHLHAKSIVYRDLKPENLMLDDQGYIKVVDFGLAKVVKDRTWTLCGTPDYLAPEIILSKGHDKAVDYWALGVLTYELTAGYVPFYAEDPMEVYQLILDGDLKFPGHFSRALSDMVRKLLNPVQGKRLGNTKEGVQGIVKHRFFSGFDWEGLFARTLTPPIRPKVASPEDTSNFDEYDVQKDSRKSCKWEPPFPFKVVDGITQF